MINNIDKEINELKLIFRDYPEARASAAAEIARLKTAKQTNNKRAGEPVKGLK